MEVLLGRYYRDAATGVEGMCKVITQDHGGTLLSVELEITPNMIPMDTQTCDPQNLIEIKGAIMTDGPNVNLPPIVDKVPERATPNPAVILGRKYRDVTTGYEGRAIVYSMSLNGCNQVLLDPGVNDKGELGKAILIDEGLIVDVETNEPVPDTAGKGANTRVTEQRY